MTDDATPEPPATERNLGPQPLDALMTERGLTNHDVVAASKLPLTHKAVQRGRKGRRLTPSMQKRVTEAFSAAVKEKDAEQGRVWRICDLFNY